MASSSRSATGTHSTPRARSAGPSAAPAPAPAGGSTSEAADVLVIFGIAGDLARKMTFGALYRLEAGHHLDCPVIGVARADWTNAQLRQVARQAVEGSAEDVDSTVFDRLAERLTFVQGDYADRTTYQRLKRALRGRTRPVFYLEIPPSLFAPVVAALGQAGLTEGARVVVEKPFGHDLASARELNRALRVALDESQILRIDHFLGKPPVLDLQYLRFANSLLEPVWNRMHVAAVQITMFEDFGVEDRGSFYDPVGALRDVVQNHLMQVLAQVAMEPPSGPGADALRDKQTEVFAAVAPAHPAHFVRGQYGGYLDVDGVARRSTTETYAALRLEVDNWRWAGVPFFLRAGKALAVRATEVRVVLRRPPRLAFLHEPLHPSPTQVVLRIDPDPGLRVQLVSRGADDRTFRDVHLDMSFAEELGPPHEPYERLLHDALRGNRSLFVRQDALEETWRVFEQVLANPPAPEPYRQGSWGPKGAAALVRGFPAWQKPWLP